MKHPEREVLLSQETIDGEDKIILQVEKPANIDEQDYLHNQFMMTADRSLIYQFDANTNLLERFHVFVHTEDDEVLVFEITEINYNPEIDDSVFTLELPDDTIEYIEAQTLPDNQRYEAMSPKEMVTAFFQACAQKDWDEVLKFRTTSHLSERFKSTYGGLTIVSIGEPFHSEAQSDLQWIVPYEIQLRPVERYTLVSNQNTAGRNVLMGSYDNDLQPLEEQDWQNEPTPLSPESPYLVMSPEEVVATFATALINLDYDTMSLFIPEKDVTMLKAQIQMAAKHNIDIQKNLPKIEVIRSFWSEEHQGTFVVTRESRTKSFNLGIRKDNKAHRFVVDGGL